MTVFKRFPVLVFLFALFFLPNFVSAAPIREVTLQPLVQSPNNNEVQYSGYATIHGGIGTLKVKARIDETSSGTSVLSSYLVNKLAPIANHHYDFTGAFSQLIPGQAYTLTFFHDGNPVEDLEVINFIFQPTPVGNYTPPNVKLKKPGGTYGSTNELDYNSVGTKIYLAGALQSDRTEQLDLEIRYKETWGSNPLTTLSGPGVFSQIVTLNQDYPFNPTITGLSPATSYTVQVFITGQQTPLWTEIIDTQPASVADHITIGGPYGTNVLTLNTSACSASPLIGVNGQPLPPAPLPANTHCLQITPNADFAVSVSSTDRQAGGTALAKSYRADAYDVSIVWGDSPSAMDHKWDNSVMSRIMNIGDTETFPYTMHELLPNHTYWYTFVDTLNPTNAYMAPKQFVSTVSSSPQGGGGGGGGNSSGGGGVGPSAPLVAPGNLVPCDGTLWQPCKFTHLMQAANNVIKFFIVIAIPIIAFGFAYVGFTFIFKGGSEEARGVAKRVIGNMLTGIVAILLGWLAVNLALDSLLDDSDPLNPASDYKYLEQQ